MTETFGSYSSSDRISDLKIFRPDDFPNTSNLSRDDDASSSNQNNFRISLFRLDDIDCFLESSLNLV
tara:strand:+ start:672 stop:872 length:201 start_codon:yes stop_codon:yes gene_type:complete